MSKGAVLNQKQEIDLNNYVTKDDLSQYSTTDQVNNLIQQSLSSYATTSQINSLQTQINALDEGWELLTDWRNSDYNLGNNYNVNYYYKIEGVFQGTTQYLNSIYPSYWIFKPSNSFSTQIVIEYGDRTQIILELSNNATHTIEKINTDMLVAFRVFVHR